MNTFPGSTAAVTISPMNISIVTSVLNASPAVTSCPSANYQQSGESAPGQFGAWPDD